MRLWVIALLFICTALSLKASPTVYEVKNYGAKGDGKTLDTAAIQSAVDAASAAGGGVVHFGAGTYVTATIQLKDHVTLDLDKETLLQASPNAADWSSPIFTPVISALNATDIGLQGAGTIDGGGLIYYGANSDGHVVAGARPESIVSFANSQHIKVSGLTFRNSVKWTQVYYECEQVLVDGVIIRNRESCLSRETDGIDISSSRHVVVQNCDIQTGDDAICVKPQGDKFQNPARPTFDVVVKNCTLATTCNSTKIGTGTKDEAYDVHFSGITVNKYGPIVRGKNSTRDNSTIAAISVQSNDGGRIHDFTFTDYTVNDCDTPIFMEVQNRLHKKFGSVENITVSNFTCLHSSRASQINVERSGVLKNITLANLTIHNFGTSNFDGSPPWLTGKYPDAEKYGEMPAYGLFARCVDGLALTGKIEFIDDGKSGRPTTKYEDVTLKPDGG